MTLPIFTRQTSLTELTPLGLSQIQGEFGGANPIKLSEYYAGGGYVHTGTPKITDGNTGGSIAISQFYGASSVLSSGIITASGTYTMPLISGQTVTAHIIAIGGGGGGGGGSGRTFSYGYWHGGGGGGGGGYSIASINLSYPDVLHITIGAGGAAGAMRDGQFSSGSNGGTGGNTWVTKNVLPSYLVYAYGGTGGINSPTGSGGAGGSSGGIAGLAASTAAEGSTTYAEGGGNTVGGFGAPGFLLDSTTGTTSPYRQSTVYGTATHENSGIYPTPGEGYGAGGSGGGCAQSDVYDYQNAIAAAGSGGAVMIWWWG
jgi:hypothetical protein